MSSSSSVGFLFRVLVRPADECIFFVHRPEATIALRQRLNETVDELDQVKIKLAELEVRSFLLLSLDASDPT